MNVPQRRASNVTEQAAARPVYLDCNATTPLEPGVREVMLHFFDQEYGNAGSRTHEFGLAARKAVEEARGAVAAVAKSKSEEVVFTSGATEANNLAILGLADLGQRTSRRHIVSTAIEHKAVLEPLDVLRQRGFTVDLAPPTRHGWVAVDEIMARVRPDTLLVSVMHANNETGVLQPIAELAAALSAHEAYLHVDAAQGFGKDDQLEASRIDLISVSAHKVFGPKGVGALIARRRGFNRVPITPLLFGGGQERGLRPGTLPVALIAAFGEAARLAKRDGVRRKERCMQFRNEILTNLAPLQPLTNGDQNRCLPHVLNISFPGVDSEALLVALKQHVAISNGAACTSHSYETSHVLKAMQLDARDIAGAIRLSWCHLTPAPNWNAMTSSIRALLG